MLATRRRGPLKAVLLAGSRSRSPDPRIDLAKPGADVSAAAVTSPGRRPCL
jgi:hypothetical protein